MVCEMDREACAQVRTGSTARQMIFFFFTPYQTNPKFDNTHFFVMELGVSRY